MEAWLLRSGRVISCLIPVNPQRSRPATMLSIRTRGCPGSGNTFHSPLPTLFVSLYRRRTRPKRVSSTSARMAAYGSAKRYCQVRRSRLSLRRRWRQYRRRLSTFIPTPTVCQPIWYRYGYICSAGYVNTVGGGAGTSSFGVNGPMKGSL